MPKGDAQQLRADLDDGFTRLANLLLEGLCAAPLSGAEFRVLNFVIRRTYGWAKAEKRDAGKMDTITAAEMIRGTGLPRGTASHAIASLCKARVLLTALAAPNNLRRYGVNPDLNSWGQATTDWSVFRMTLKDARDTSVYNRTDLYPNSARPLAENGQTSSRKRTGEPSSSTDSLTDNDTDTDTTLVASANAEPTPLLPDVVLVPTPASEPAPVKPRRTRTVADPDEVQANLDDLRAKFDPCDLEEVDGFVEMARQHRVRGVMALTVERSLTKDLLALRDEPHMTSEAFAYGIAAAIRKPAANVNYTAKAARGHLAEGAGASTGGKAPFPGNGVWWRMFDGTICKRGQEDWTELGALQIDYLREQGIFNPKTGCTFEPKVGFCCDDGLYYSSRNWPEGVPIGE